MIRLRGLGPKRRTVQSWFGWPVPADLRLVSSDQLMTLISTAQQRGFSRTAKGIHPRGGRTFGVLPYLYEGSPEASWICLVVDVNDWTSSTGSRPEVAFGRLDVALADFNSLRRAGRRQRDQLLHWTTWLAFKSGAVPRSDAGTD